MTPAEYQAGLERLAAARAELQKYEELALELAAEASQPDRSILLCVKEQLHATRLLVLEVGERCGKGPAPRRSAGWGSSGFVP